MNDLLLRSSIDELARENTVSSNGLTYRELNPARLKTNRGPDEIRPVLEYESVQTWFDGLRPSLGYKRHGLTYLEDSLRFTANRMNSLNGPALVYCNRKRGSPSVSNIVSNS